MRAEKTGQYTYTIDNIAEKERQLQAAASGAKNSILGRKIWTEVVSTIAEKNLSLMRSAKEKLMIRIANMGISSPYDPETLCHLALSFLEKGALIVTFDASFLKNTDTISPYFLNGFERKPLEWNKNGYAEDRLSTENTIFSRLDARVKTLFLKNYHARPRYGALYLVEEGVPLKPSKGYGASFVVLKDVVKLNTLFCAGDSMRRVYYDRQPYLPCTVTQFELLLQDSHDDRLRALLELIATGELPKTYDQCQVKPSDYKDTESGYIEAMLPSINLFDSQMVSQIYISPYEYRVSEEMIGIFCDAGISMSNAWELPFDIRKEASLPSLGLFGVKNNVQLRLAFAIQDASDEKLFELMGDASVVFDEHLMKKYFFSIIKKNNDELTQLFLTRSDLTVRSRVLDELYRSVEELSDKRKIAQWQLFVYHEEIKTLSPFHYKHRFMGMSFGFSCGEKQKAAEALIEFLKIEKGDFSLLVPHKKVLVNGSLGKITERLIEKGFLEKEASNVVACAETALKF